MADEVNKEIVDSLTDTPPATAETGSKPVVPSVDVSQYEEKIKALEAQVAQQKELADSVLTENVTGREALNRIAKVAGKTDEELQALIEDAERQRQVQPSVEQVQEQVDETKPQSVEAQVKAIMDEREQELDARIKDSYDTRKQLAIQTMDAALEASVEASEDIANWTKMLTRTGVGSDEVSTATQRMKSRIEERAQKILLDKREEAKGQFELKWISGAYAEASTQVGEELRAMVGGAYDKIGAASDVVSQYGQVLEEPDAQLPDFSKGNPREHKDAFDTYIKQKYAKAAAKEQAARAATKG